jgi:hypothetical protein
MMTSFSALGAFLLNLFESHYVTFPSISFPGVDCLLDTDDPAFYVEVVSIRLRRTHGPDLRF